MSKDMLVMIPLASGTLTCSNICKCSQYNDSTFFKKNKTPLDWCSCNKSYNQLKLQDSRYITQLGSGVRNCYYD